MAIGLFYVTSLFAIHGHMNCHSHAGCPSGEDTHLLVELVLIEHKDHARGWGNR